jgi:hypothetical protein
LRALIIMAAAIAATSTTTRAQTIWALADLLDSPKAVQLPADELKHIEATLANHNIELIERPSVNGSPGAGPKQLDLQRRFESGKYRGIFAWGANRSGKTAALWGMCFAKHLRDRAKHGDLYWCIAPDFTKLKQGPHRWLWEYLPRSMFQRIWTESLGFGTNDVMALNLPNGRGRCTIVFKTEEQDLTSFEADSVHGIAWTEPTREAVFDAIQARLVDTRGFMLLDYVPTMAWHKFRLRLSANPLWFCQGFCMRDNAHNLPVGAIEEARAGMSDRDAAIRIDGQEGSGFGVVFREFDTRIHTVKPFPVPSDWPRWRGLDYGYTNPTAVLWMAVAPDETWYFYREHYQREWAVERHARAIIAMSAGESYEDRLIVDPSIFNITQANGSTIAGAYKKAGVPCVPAVPTNKHGEFASVELIRKRLEDRKLKIFTTCPNFIREMQSWRCREGRDKEAMEVYEDKDNHTTDVARYLAMQNPCFTRRAVRTSDTREGQAA